MEQNYVTVTPCIRLQSRLATSVQTSISCCQQTLATEGIVLQTELDDHCNKLAVDRRSLEVLSIS